MTGTYKVVKRGSDATIAFVCIIFLMPLFLCIAVAIILLDGKPVIFEQTRVGKNQTCFRIFKFRTMKKNAQLIRDGLQVKHNDHRVTKLGKVLRRSSLDELPQLFNILLGDISFVGPRACLPEQIKFFDLEHCQRFKVQPGLTGLAVIKGRASIPWSRRLRWDRIYVQKISLTLDVYIILKTFSVVLLGRNVYYDHEKYGPAFDLSSPDNLPQSTEVEAKNDPNRSF